MEGRVSKLVLVEQAETQMTLLSGTPTTGSSTVFKSPTENGSLTSAKE